LIELVNTERGHRWPVVYGLFRSRHHASARTAVGTIRTDCGLSIFKSVHHVTRAACTATAATVSLREQRRVVTAPAEPKLPLNQTTVMELLP
jgi:hypothetical protein